MGLLQDDIGNFLLGYSFNEILFAGSDLLTFSRRICIDSSRSIVILDERNIDAEMWQLLA